MTPEHLELLTTARSHLVALARDQDNDTYDDLLLDLDHLPPEVDATPITPPTVESRDEWHAITLRTLRQLAVHDVHGLSLAVLTARLQDAWQDEQATAGKR
jgi:hypothetical protein